MKSGAELEGAFQARGIVRGGTLLLRANDAVQLLLAAQAERVRVLGVDAFRITPETTQPVMEHSLDVISSTLADEPWRTVADFVLQQPDDLYFEVVLE